MDPGMIKAGVAAAIALTLFVPTFHALNASYVQDVPPPPWLPTPPTPPDIKPPTMTPPPDFKPPPDYEGKLPPGAQCPPPVLKRFPEFNGTMSPSQGYAQTLFFEVPQGAIAFGGLMNFTNWQAASISATLVGPTDTVYSNSTQGDAFVAQSTSRNTNWKYDSTQDGQPPAPGNYTLNLAAQFPIQGRVHAEFAYALPCGGLVAS